MQRAAGELWKGGGGVAGRLQEITPGRRAVPQTRVQGELSSCSQDGFLRVLSARLVFRLAALTPSQGRNRGRASPKCRPHERRRPVRRAIPAGCEPLPSALKASPGERTAGATFCPVQVPEVSYAAAQPPFGCHPGACSGVGPASSGRRQGRHRRRGAPAALIGGGCSQLRLPYSR